MDWLNGAFVEDGCSGTDRCKDVNGNLFSWGLMVHEVLPTTAGTLGVSVLSGDRKTPRANLEPMSCSLTHVTSSLQQTKETKSQTDPSDLALPRFPRAKFVGGSGKEPNS